jgi:holo-[acyl-carrier protein] synthase
VVGVDIVDIARITAAVEKHGDKFLEKVFTENEIAYAKGKRHMGETLAGRFAAKEAFIKAQGRGIPWKEIEVCRDGNRPFITYEGKRYNGVSISHERAYAIAMVVIEKA